MERINGNNTVDIGGGKRGFRSQNAAAGVAGTEVTDKFLNDIQEEISAVIEKSGLELDPDNQQQLWESLQNIAAPGFANRTAWLPVISTTITAPPNNAFVGDAYIIPSGATGAWAGHAQNLAEWSGVKWRIAPTRDGHGVSLPDGRVLEKINGIYVEKIAQDVQSGKWNFVEAAGTPNSIIANLSPPLIAYTPGLRINIKVATTNTGVPTVDLNGLGSKAIVDRVGDPLSAGDLLAGEITCLVYDGVRFRTIGRAEKANQNIGSSGFHKLSGDLIMQWGGFGATTLSSVTNGGVYESGPVNILWPVAFPRGALQSVVSCDMDVSGYGLQEQAWFSSITKNGATGRLACRKLDVNMSGSYIVLGW